MTDHTHSDYADGFDAGVEAGAQQFRDFLAKHAPVYVKDIQQWHRDFLVARNAGVAIPETVPIAEYRRVVARCIELGEKIAHGMPEVQPDLSGETDAQRREVVAAWNDLPEALRAHPGLKRLYRALGGVAERTGGVESRKS